MVNILTKLKVIDNSGPKIIKCIKVLNKSKKQVAKVGDIIVASVEKLKKSGGRFKKGDVVLALVVRTRRKVIRKNGLIIYGDDNAAVIIKQKKDLYGTRVIGPMYTEIKDKGYFNILKKVKYLI